MSIQETFKKLLPDNQKIIEAPIIKTVFLLHPHWVQDKKGYRNLVKGLPDIFQNARGYLIRATGNCTFKGIIILKRLFKHIQKHELVDKVFLGFKDEHSRYVLDIKIKD